jgi:MFS family permease
VRTDLSWLSTDARRILAARGLRSFAYGYLSITLGVYLAQLGLSPVAVGVVLTATLLGSALFTIALTLVADRFGRRRMLILLALLMIVASLVFAFSGSFWPLFLAALTGTLSPNSGEGGGAFVPLEQAMLPQTAPDAQRTNLFVLYNLLGSLAGAFGGLFSGFASQLVAPGSDPLALYRGLFVLAALLAVVNIVLFLPLSRQVERPPSTKPVSLLGVHRSRGTVLKLSALFSLDSVAGGFTLQSIVAFWFFERWGLGLDALGPIFFGVNFLNAVSYLLAGRVAARVGLLNTIVFTHLPASCMLLLIPLMPTVELAILVFVGRQILSQMDVPTRQSYTMAVVDPDERVAAAGFTGVARNLSQVLSPTLAGYAMQVAALGLPFFISGTLKILYDLSMYAVFRQVRPPEEQPAPTSPTPRPADAPSSS